MLNAGLFCCNSGNRLKLRLSSFSSPGTPEKPLLFPKKARSAYFFGLEKPTRFYVVLGRLQRDILLCVTVEDAEEVIVWACHDLPVIKLFECSKEFRLTDHSHSSNIQTCQICNHFHKDCTAWKWDIDEPKYSWFKQSKNSESLYRKRHDRFILHREIPNFDREIVSRQKISSIVRELYIRYCADDFRKETPLIWLFWLVEF